MFYSLASLEVTVMNILLYWRTAIYLESTWYGTDLDTGRFNDNTETLGLKYGIAVTAMMKYIHSIVVSSWDKVILYRIINVISMLFVHLKHHYNFFRTSTCGGNFWSMMYATNNHGSFSSPFVLQQRKQDQWFFIRYPTRAGLGRSAPEDANRLATDTACLYGRPVWRGKRQRGLRVWYRGPSCLVQ